MKTIEEMIKVMQAYKDGKKIECRSSRSDEWGRCGSPLWDWSNCDYRIKSESKLRPWTYEEACQQLGKIIKHKTIKNTRIIHSVTEDSEGKVSIGMFSIEEIFDKYVFLDGSPCGVEEK